MKASEAKQLARDSFSQEKLDRLLRGIYTNVEAAAKKGNDHANFNIPRDIGEVTLDALYKQLRKDGYSVIMSPPPIGAGIQSIMHIYWNGI